MEGASGFVCLTHEGWIGFCVRSLSGVSFFLGREGFLERPCSPTPCPEVVKSPMGPGPWLEQHKKHTSDRSHSLVVVTFAITKLNHVTLHALHLSLLSVALQHRTRAMTLDWLGHLPDRTTSQWLHHAKGRRSNRGHTFTTQRMPGRLPNQATPSWIQSFSRSTDF